MSKCAVLCNGNTRSAYPGRDGYDFVVGCNIPWTDVDATVIMDEGPVNLWFKQPDIINVPAYFGSRACEAVDQLNGWDFFQSRVIGKFDEKRPYYSSGHMAVLQVAIPKQFDQIDIYGCDVWFSDFSNNSFTSQFIPKDTTETANLRRNSMELERAKHWLILWKKIVSTNNHIKFNFIK